MVVKKKESSKRTNPPISNPAKNHGESGLEGELVNQVSKVEGETSALVIIKELNKNITGGKLKNRNAAVVVLILGVGMLLRLTMGLNSYSGEGVAPMFGDYEAQRHWMEITYHLPITKWYFYELERWGLDYPPLTAFHSLLCGYIAHYLNPDWVALDISRGYESVSSKVFMRMTALVSDLVIFFPTALFFSKKVRQSTKELKLAGLLLLLVNPCFYLIDHGHFQYNCVMLGFTLLSTALMSRGYHLLGAISFSLALGFKQMALYFALPVFFYLLGQSFSKGFFRGLTSVISLGIVTLGTFSLLLLPFILEGHQLDGDWGLTQLTQIGIRVFPLARGLYEDKVANLWCAANVFIKLRESYSLPFLARLSAATTLLVALPSCLNLLRFPTPQRLVYSLAVTSLSFFLLGFQVHEKTILLPTLPIALLYLQGTESSFLIRWFTNVAVFSMYPLLKRDGLALPYLTSLILWNLFVLPSKFLKWQFTLTTVGVLEALSTTGLILLHLTELLLPAPARYPDLHLVLNTLYAAPHFLVTLIYLTYRQLTLPADHPSSSPRHLKRE